jgi:hypothetical protein
MVSSLLLHKGSRLVTREELALVPVPAATKTWFPVPHSTVVDRVRTTMQEAGFAVKRESLALSRSNARLFGTLDVESGLAEGVDLCIGVRNSLDKSFPIAFCGGHRVLVCDNLAFSSEIVVSRKHTRHGADRFQEAICKAVQGLEQFRKAESGRIAHQQRTEIPDVAAESLMLRAYERGLVSSLQLPALIRGWRAPPHEVFRPRTLWSLWNAFTAATTPVQRSNPQRYCSLTIALQGLFPSPAIEAAAGTPTFVSA